MSYGPEKLSSSDALDGIIKTIREHLSRTDSFSNNSIGYHGIEFSYIVEVKMHARGSTELSVNGAGSVGDVSVPGSAERAISVDGKKSYSGKRRNDQAPV